jgi:hypothetical protein
MGKEELIYCPYCGKSNSNNHTKCIECGSLIKRVEKKKYIDEHAFLGSVPTNQRKSFPLRIYFNSDIFGKKINIKIQENLLKQIEDFLTKNNPERFTMKMLYMQTRFKMTAKILQNEITKSIPDISSDKIIRLPFYNETHKIFEIILNELFEKYYEKEIQALKINGILSSNEVLKEKIIEESERRIQKETNNLKIKKLIEDNIAYKLEKELDNNKKNNEDLRDLLINKMNSLKKKIKEIQELSVQNSRKLSKHITNLQKKNFFISKLESDTNKSEEIEVLRKEIEIINLEINQKKKEKEVLFNQIKELKMKKESIDLNYQKNLSEYKNSNKELIKNHQSLIQTVLKKNVENSVKISEINLYYIPLHLIIIEYTENFFVNFYIFFNNKKTRPTVWYECKNNLNSIENQEKCRECIYNFKLCNMCEVISKILAEKFMLLH